MSLSFILCERVDAGTVGIQKESEAAGGTHALQRGSAWAAIVDFFVATSQVDDHRSCDASQVRIGLVS